MLDLLLLLQNFHLLDFLLNEHLLGLNIFHHVSLFLNLAFPFSDLCLLLVLLGPELLLKFIALILEFLQFII